MIPSYIFSPNHTWSKQLNSLVGAPNSGVFATSSYSKIESVYILKYHRVTFVASGAQKKRVENSGLVCLRMRTRLFFCQVYCLWLHLLRSHQSRLLYRPYKPVWGFFSFIDGKARRFRNNTFFRGGVVSSTPNPSLEDHGLQFAWDGWPYQEITSSHHASPGHLGAQTSSAR